jgi:hypothetical protein
MDKEHDVDRSGLEAARAPSSEPSGQASRPDPYPTMLDRINNFFGRFVGSHGRRHGARDTDPGG